MNRLLSTSVLALAVLCSAVHASTPAPTPTPVYPPDSVEISRDDAVSLFGALSTVKAGLSLSNTGIGGEDIYNLKSIADSYQSTVNKKSLDEDRARTSAKSPADAMQKLEDDWDAYRHGKEHVKLLKLTPFSEQEVKDGAISMALIAPIQHFLYPDSAIPK